MTLTEVTAEQRMEAYEAGRKNAMARIPNPYCRDEEPVLHQDYEDGMYDDRMKRQDKADAERWC